MIEAIDRNMPGYGYGELAAQQGWKAAPAIEAAVECKQRGKFAWAYFAKVYQTHLKAREPDPAPAPHVIPASDPEMVARYREKLARMKARAQGLAS